MSENLHDIDKLFKDGIEGHEEMPSGKVWDTIDNNLDKSNIIQIKRKYNNLKRLAIALLLLLLGTVVYEIQTKKTGKEELVNANSNINKKTGSNKETHTAEQEKTNADNVEKKWNGSDKIETNATASSAADNTQSNNAGKDDVVGAAKVKTNNTGKTIVNLLPQPADKKSKGGNRKIEKDGSLVEKNTTDQLIVKSPIKKSSIHKTRMSVKNGSVAEDIPADKNKGPENLKDNVVAAGSNELTPLQKDKAEKITPDLQKNKTAVINAERITPDVNVANAVAKNKTNKSLKPFHFNLKAFYSPQFSFNRLKDDRHDPGPQPRNGRDEIKKDEQHQIASSFGVLVEIPVGKKWSLQSGVTYLNKRISIEPKKIFAKLDDNGQVKYRFDCSSGYTYIAPKTGTNPAVGDSVSALASSNTLQYLGIPLEVNYTFSIGKFNIVPSVGTAINFLVKQKIVTELIQGTSKEKQTINTIEGLKPTYFNLFTGIALEYNLSKRIAFSFIPSGNFALTSINKDAAVKSYPNSFGLAGGVKIKF